MVAAAVATDLRIAARDGFEVAATCFEPSAHSGTRGTVLVVPATGVARRLYRGFATVLAEEGFRVLTWDWRGTGGSRPASLRGFRATMLDWATLDFAGALDWAATQGGPVLAVGHSFGGQALGLVARGSESGGIIAAAVTVAAQSGYWRHWPRPQRYWYATVWHVVVPVLTTLYGYFPSRLLRFGEDLPAGVARQWARWCRSPDYLGDWRGHERLAVPMLSLAFADDAYAPPAAVAALHRRYSAARLETRLVRPRDVGVARIGHFGFFKPGLPGLWQDASAWLGAAAAAPAPAVRVEREGSANAASTGPAGSRSIEQLAQRGE